MTMCSSHVISLVRQQIAAVICGVSLLLCSTPYLSQSAAHASDKAALEKADRIERAVQFICQEQARDPKSTLPIDKMAAQPLMPVTVARVVAGRDRAQSMLPIAKRLLPFALSQVAANNNLEPLNVKWIVERIQSVTAIKPDVSEGDNASWNPAEPNTIVFGTVYLSALRSNEAMLAVLAHEITHAINGTDNALEPVFRRISQKTSLKGRAAEELLCELVALEVVRDYINQTPRQGFRSRRLARPLYKNCVSLDLSDAHHLSPRQTMRMLISLDPKLNFAVTHQPKTKQAKRTPVKKTKRSRKVR